MSEPEPEISASGELLYQRVLPLMQQDEENGWFGRYFCAAIMGMLQGLDQIAFGDAEHGPWCVVADPSVCPELWLPWEASIYGVELSPGVSAEVERETIEELPPQKRGGIEAMAKAAAPALIGAGTATEPEFSLELVERPAGKAYAIFGNVFPEPSAIEKEAIEVALLTQKAGGIKLTMSWGAPSWEDATLAWEEAAGTWAGATLADVT
jgi:hypothetical protein